MAKQDLPMKVELLQLRLAAGGQVAEAGIDASTLQRHLARGEETRWGSGRTSSFESGERRHLDYGYSVTIHSSQGQTAGRVLVHVETERAGEKLVNQRLAYVAVSRGQYDARIYTDDRARLARALDRDFSIDLLWRERRSKYRDNVRTARSRGVNRSVTRWPSTVDGFGAVTFGTPVALAAIVDWKQRQVRSDLDE